MIHEDYIQNIMGKWCETDIYVIRAVTRHARFNQNFLYFHILVKIDPTTNHESHVYPHYEPEVVCIKNHIIILDDKKALLLATFEMIHDKIMLPW